MSKAIGRAGATSRRNGWAWPGVMVAALSVVLTVMAPASSGGAQIKAPPGMTALLAAAPKDSEPLLAVAMLDHAPSKAQVAALRAQGLTVQPLKHLPMALTKGTRPQLLKAFSKGLARDFYPDRPLSWHSEESTAAMSADLTRNLGYTGKDIGIAIVDSGIDASHPVLKNRVVHNVRVYSPEYLSVTGVPYDFPGSPALVIPFDALPYNNTDTIGHGTHVAGLAAGDATDNAELIGVAPEAHLVGYSTGEVLFIFTALASFDDILDKQDDYNIRVINNSWGSGYSLFDPDAPINVATKVLHDAGITVVFSAGNSYEEMTTGPNSHAPWVISVAAGTVSKEKGDFSSQGLMYDNSASASIPDDGHLRFEGDGLGITHPDITAPGVNIVGPGTPTGVTATTGTPPGGEATLSGTSMAAPHIAGLAAVMLQANPALTPDQVRQAMEVTAVPMRDASLFHATGYGYADAKAAVDLVTRADFSQALLDRMQAERDSAILAARDYRVLASDHWTFQQLPITVGGLDSRDFSFEVGPDTTAIRASAAFPTDLGLVGLNLLFEWSLELLDPDGVSVASSTLSSTSGLSLLMLDFAEAGISPKPGTWTLRAVGQANASQPALLFGPTVTVVATQLKAQSKVEAPKPVFTPTGALSFRFTGGGGSLSSPEGCDYDPSGVSGSLSLDAAPADTCSAGTVGYLVNYAVGTPAEFVSEPLSEALTLGGAGELRAYLVDLLSTAYGVAFSSGLSYQLDAVAADGTVTAVTGGDMTDPTMIGASTPTAGSYAFEVPTTEIAAGSSLRLRLLFSGVYTSTMRLVWDGAYGDAGLKLTTGKLETPSSGGGSSGGSSSGGSSSGGSSDSGSEGGGAFDPLLLVLLALTALAARRLPRRRARV